MYIILLFPFFILLDIIRYSSSKTNTKSVETIDLPEFRGEMFLYESHRYYCIICIVISLGEEM